METYYVSIPITGIAYVTVEAESEEQAIEKAMEDVNLKSVEEWEAHRQIVKGNVFYGMQNEAEAHT